MVGGILPGGQFYGGGAIIRRTIIQEAIVWGEKFSSGAIFLEPIGLHMIDRDAKSFLPTKSF